MYCVFVLHRECEKEWSPWNCVLLSREECRIHVKLGGLHRYREECRIHVKLGGLHRYSEECRIHVKLGGLHRYREV